jgi:hypothetical protein
MSDGTVIGAGAQSVEGKRVRLALQPSPKCCCRVRGSLRSVAQVNCLRALIRAHFTRQGITRARYR